jgi:allophanate hydrolase subunit 2
MNLTAAQTIVFSDLGQATQNTLAVAAGMAVDPQVAGKLATYTFEAIGGTVGQVEGAMAYAAGEAVAAQVHQILWGFKPPWRLVARWWV